MAKRVARAHLIAVGSARPSSMRMVSLEIVWVPWLAIARGAAPPGPGIPGGTGVARTGNGSRRPLEMDSHEPMNHHKLYHIWSVSRRVGRTGPTARGRIGI